MKILGENCLKSDRSFRLSRRSHQHTTQHGRFSYKHHRSPTESLTGILSAESAPRIFSRFSQPLFPPKSPRCLGVPLGRPKTQRGFPMVYLLDSKDAVWYVMRTKENVCTIVITSIKGCWTPFGHYSPCVTHRGVNTHGGEKR